MQTKDLRILFICSFFALFCLFSLGKSAFAEQAIETQEGEPPYYMGRFRSDTAVCAVDEDHWGIISRNGSWIVEPIYTYIQDAPDWEEITDDMSPMFDRLYYGGFEKGFYLITNDSNGQDQFGFYCIETATLCEPYWAELYLDNPVQSLILVCDPITYKWGYINWQGEVAIPCQYDEAYSFEDGLAGTWSEADGCFYIIDETGNIVGTAREE